MHRFLQAQGQILEGREARHSAPREQGPLDTCGMRWRLSQVTEKGPHHPLGLLQE